MSSEVLSRAVLDAFDPHPFKSGREMRFLCPLDGCRDKPRDRAHRSLALRTSGDNKGLWKCHRCGASGKIKDEWAERAPSNVRQRARAALSRPAVEQEVPALTAEDYEKVERLREVYVAARSNFSGSPAAAYLERRGIPQDVSVSAGVGFVESWPHARGLTDRRAVFPVTDRNGALVALSSRAIDAEFHTSKAITHGRKSLGVFTTPDAVVSRLVAVVEAPVDALALSSVGIPAVAGIGTSFPVWLPRALSWKSVLLATDADSAGDGAAENLTSEVRARGGRVFRLRPRGAKDWAEVLERHGLAFMQDRLSVFLDSGDDEHTLESALWLARSGRKEAARFVASLVSDAESRETFISYLRGEVAPGELLRRFSSPSGITPDVYVPASVPVEETADYLRNAEANRRVS